MRLFYLIKYPNGIYRVRFVDQETGLRTTVKSTQTKNYREALAIANKWILHGIPTERVNSKKGKNIVSSFGENINSFFAKQCVNKLDDEKAFALYQSLSNRFGNSVPPSNFVLNDSVSLNKETRPSAKEIKPSTSSSGKLKKDNKKISNLLDLPVGDFLTDFWTAEKSKYIISQRAHGYSITERHCKEMRGIVKRYWIPYFADTKISEIDSEELEDFFLFLKIDKNLSGATVNKAINCGNVAFKYCAKHKMIDYNPMESIERYAINESKRGILNDTEVSKLFQLEWTDNVQKCASMVAAFSGLRAGEISGLRVCDVEDNVLHVRHSWSSEDGLKDTKNHRFRDVPIVPEISRALLRHARLCKHYSDTSYIFFSYKNNQEQPLLPSVFEDSLYEAMEKIGISEDQRKERNIVFHSWRHYFATQMANRMKLEQAQQALGHLTPTMTEHYADHKTLENLMVLNEAVNDNFKNVIKFPLNLTA